MKKRMISTVIASVLAMVLAMPVVTFANTTTENEVSVTDNFDIDRAIELASDMSDEEFAEYVATTPNPLHELLKSEGSDVEVMNANARYANKNGLVATGLTEDEEFAKRTGNLEGPNALHIWMDDNYNITKMTFYGEEVSCQAWDQTREERPNVDVVYRYSIKPAEYGVRYSLKDDPKRYYSATPPENIENGNLFYIEITGGNTTMFGAGYNVTYYPLGQLSINEEQADGTYYYTYGPSDPKFVDLIWSSYNDYYNYRTTPDYDPSEDETLTDEYKYGVIRGTADTVIEKGETTNKSTTTLVVNIFGADRTLNFDINYNNYAYYTGKEKNSADDLGIKDNLGDVKNAEVGTLRKQLGDMYNNFNPAQYFRLDVEYVVSGTNAGQAKFIPRLVFNDDGTGSPELVKEYNMIRAIVKEMNRAMEHRTYEYTIKPIDISDNGMEVTVKAKKKGGKYVVSGKKLKKVQYVAVTTPEGNTIQFNKDQFKIKVKKQSKKAVKLVVTGKGGNVTGQVKIKIK